MYMDTSLEEVTQYTEKYPDRFVGLATLPLVISAVFSGARADRRRAAEPWACGYLPDSHMTVTAHSFAQPIRQKDRAYPLANDHCATSRGDPGTVCA